MRATRLLLLGLFAAACGSRSAAPATPTAAAPANTADAPPPAPVAAKPAPPPVDVAARCAELDRASKEAEDAARVLATTTTDLPAAVTCLADALDDTSHMPVWGTEQEFD